MFVIICFVGDAVASNSAAALQAMIDYNSELLFLKKSIESLSNNVEEKEDIQEFRSKVIEIMQEISSNFKKVNNTLAGKNV